MDPPSSFQRSAMSDHRILVRNLRYGCTKNQIRNLVELIGVLTVQKIKIVRLDQQWRPRHCSAFLTLQDVSWYSKIIILVLCKITFVYFFQVDYLFHILK